MPALLFSHFCQYPLPIPYAPLLPLPAAAGISGRLRCCWSVGGSTIPAALGCHVPDGSTHHADRLGCAGVRARRMVSSHPVATSDWLGCCYLPCWVLIGMHNMHFKQHVCKSVHDGCFVPTHLAQPTIKRAPSACLPDSHTFGGMAAQVGRPEDYWPAASSPASWGRPSGMPSNRQAASA